MSIDEIRELLPLPSESPSEQIQVPTFDCREAWCPDRQCTIPIFGVVTFEKEYVDGICIGWRLKA